MIGEIKMAAKGGGLAVATLAVWTAGFALFVAPVAGQFGQREVPLGFCSVSSMSSATPLTVSTCARATFTGTGSGTNLTASSVTGLILPGDAASGTGVPAGTTIVSQSSGVTGGAGVYVTSNPTTSSGASLTTGGVPVGATYAVICAYVQAVNYRDDGAAPTASTGTGGQGIASGNCIGYVGTMTALQFIQQASGAILGVSFYR
jgi:hypothetical protein